MEPLKIKFKRLDEKAVLPTYAHEGDICMDMTAISVEYDREKDLYIYHTGWAVETNPGVGQFLFPRSCNCKTDAFLTNSVEVVDSALYRGEIVFCYKNRDSIQTIATLDTLSKLQQWDCTGDMVQEILRHKLKTYQDQALDFAPYKVGERIGQFMLLQHPKIEIEEVNELSDTERGTGGFGSTGK